MHDCEEHVTRDNLKYFKDWIILAPALEIVNSINSYMINMNDHEARLYLSSTAYVSLIRMLIY